MTFSLVDDRLGAPLQPGPAVATDPGRPFQPHVERAPCGRASSLACSPVRRHNESHGQFDAELFEIANVYLPTDGHLSRTSRPGWRWSRAAISGGSRASSRPCWLGCTSTAPLKARPVEFPLFAPGRAAELLLGDTHLGYLGEIDRRPARRNSSCAKRARRRSWSSMSY